ncbi:uncharacterized protein [Panulirus ornatus]|uniref:uncharacterized protein n=1 Tax=Panulirus ornatus TaxID=150431 RepID=UPI003A8C5AA8
MKTLMILCAVAACASAQLVYRAPSHDSAIIQSHRLGGNFAYSTNEAHAYAVQTPVIGHRTVPVGVSYHPGAPIVKTSTDVITQQIPQYGLGYGAVPYAGAYGALPYAGAYAGAYGAYPYPYSFGAPLVAAEPAAAEPAAAEPAAAEPAAAEPVVETA